MSSSVRVVASRELVFNWTLDIYGGTVGLILARIIMILLVPAIYIASLEPIFFSQIRIGKNGKRF